MKIRIKNKNKDERRCRQGIACPCRCRVSFLCGFGPFVQGDSYLFCSLIAPVSQSLKRPRGGKRGGARLGEVDTKGQGRKWVRVRLKAVNRRGRD